MKALRFGIMPKWGLVASGASMFGPWRVEYPMPLSAPGPVLDKILLALAAYAVLAMLAWVVSERMIFPAPSGSYRTGEDLLRIATDDGVELAALWLGPLPGEDEPPFTILFSHGNGEDLGDVRPVLEELRSAGFAVLAWDYRGYGLSGGRPSEAACYRDIEAMYRHLTEERGIPPRRILVYGRSVGSGPSVDLASRVPVGGLVVESGFATAFTVMTRVPLFPFDRFRNIGKIPRVSAPILLIHGMQDEVVPFSHGERLFAAANEPRSRLWLERAGHNDVWAVARGPVLEALKELGARVERENGRR